ncbi:hypothetical protein KR018_000926 [Drosophila ironensis]|nr:hypothetical protein KR018_000926 [Drosophila ironensis]
MQIFLGLVLSVAFLDNVLSQITNLDAYIEKIKKQADNKLKMYNDKLDRVRLSFDKHVDGMDWQVKFMQQKLEDAANNLQTISDINPKVKDCVEKYMSYSPKILDANNESVNCKPASIDNILNIPKANFSSLRTYYDTNLKDSLANCIQKYRESSLNYTNCVLKTVATLETNLARHWREFQKNLDEVKFNAKTRIRTAWQCAFNILHTTSYNLGSSLRLINDCISNERSCGSISCAPRCPHEMQLDIKERDFQRITIKNPFHGADRHLGCMELRFK